MRRNPDEDKPMEMEQTTMHGGYYQKDQQQGKLDPFFNGTTKEQPGMPKWRNN